MDEIKQIMANFSELDVTKRGLLTQHTVDEWLRPPDGDPMGGFKKPGTTLVDVAEFFVLRCY